MSVPAEELQEPPTLALVIDDDESMRLLARMVLGCDQMQGYLFSPPVDSQRLEELLARELVVSH